MSDDQARVSTAFRTFLDEASGHAQAWRQEGS